MSLDFRKPQFLKHPYEDCVLRTTWEPEIQKFSVFVRFSGEKEYEVDQSTKIFADAELQPQPITEPEYWSF